MNRQPVPSSAFERFLDHCASLYEVALFTSFGLAIASVQRYGLITADQVDLSRELLRDIVVIAILVIGGLYAACSFIGGIRLIRRSRSSTVLDLVMILVVPILAIIGVLWMLDYL